MQRIKDKRNGQERVCVWPRTVSRCCECEKQAAHASSARLFFLSPPYLPSLARSIFPTLSPCAHKVVDFRGLKRRSRKRIHQKINRCTLEAIPRL
jgi:tRNA U34 5-methylaminomethyl-2-thiouridine-forming methyltransferase MnmC